MLGLALGFVVWNWGMVVYLLGQARGQARVLWQARPVEEVLADPAFPDSLKLKLRFAQKAREFAIDSLGLSDSDSYNTVFDQQGQPLLWVVVACEPFAMRPYRWRFPLVGEFPYKGYFELPLAERERDRLREQGLDARLREVGAWSTLGYFDDPILSGMLERTWGELASVVVHELTHATLFVPDDVDFNESLATFVGNQGALRFLESHFGPRAEATLEFGQVLRDEKRYVDFMLGGARTLDSLYRAMDHQGLPHDQRALRKDEALRGLFAQARALPFERPQDYRFLERVAEPDNSYFVGFLTYHSHEDSLAQVFEQRHGSDFARFLAELRQLYPSL